jgi:DNA-binding NarL/FixJ family response regulator
MENKTTSNHGKEKVDQHSFLIAWSTGMDDHEIARKLGVSLETVKTVKQDLFGEKRGP